MARLREDSEVVLAILNLYVLFGSTRSTTGAQSLLVDSHALDPSIRCAASEQLYCPLPLISRVCIQTASQMSWELYTVNIFFSHN